MLEQFPFYVEKKMPEDFFKRQQSFFKRFSFKHSSHVIYGMVLQLV
jgi:hypothetical protein